jgi:hypothetical protein
VHVNELEGWPPSTRVSTFRGVPSARLDSAKSTAGQLSPTVRVSKEVASMPLL